MMLLIIFIELIMLGLALLIAVFAFSLSMSFFFGAPFVTTPMSVIREMILLAAINADDIVVDLGSGDGRVLTEAAKICKSAKGWEINPFLVLWTRIVAKRQNVTRKVIVYCHNYQKAQLHGATVVFAYNIPGFIPALEKKLQNELKRGTRIVSYKFPLSGFRLLKKTQSGIFLYRA